jgi:hypothetical protein
MVACSNRRSFSRPAYTLASETELELVPIGVARALEYPTSAYGRASGEVGSYSGI